MESKKDVIPTSDLGVIIEYCQKERANINFSPIFKIFKNDSLIKDITYENPESYTKEDLKYINNQYIFNFKNLEFANYRIEYNSIFGKTENYHFKIADNKKQLIELCLDYFNYKAETHVPFIDRLKENENYTIMISSIGDFTGGKLEAHIVISKSNNTYFVEFKKNKKKLNQSQIDFIKHFELELINMESYGCSTVDSYLLTYNNEKIQISDGSCAWEGFNVLFKQLFPSDLD